jgi:hypothetical protein
MTFDIDRLRAFRAPDATPDPQAHAAARAALLEAISQATRHTRTSSGHKAPALHGRRRRHALLGGLTLAGGVAAVAIALASGLGQGEFQPEGAAAALTRVAAVATDQPDIVLASGQYWYSRSESLQRTTAVGGPHPYTVLLRTRTESWIDRDGHGRQRHETVGDPTFVTPADRQAWIAAGWPQIGWTSDELVGHPGGRSYGPRTYTFGASLLSYAQLRSLPTNPDELLDRVRQAAIDWHTDDSQAMEMFTVVGELFRDTPLPRHLRAALYQVVARIPGVTLGPRMRDGHGRTGVTVALSSGDTRKELVFDPDTAALLDERTVMRHEERESGGLPGGTQAVTVVPPGTVWENAYLASGVVDSIKERP